MKKKILVVICAHAVESVLSGNAAVMSRILQTYVDNVAIAIALSSRSLENKVN